MHTAQQIGSEQVGIMNLQTNRGQRIAKPANTLTSSPLEFLQNILGRTHRHPQVARFHVLLIGVEQSTVSEGGPNQGGRPSGHQHYARLREETVSPAPGS